ncbi:hypothetical protein PTTG_12223 [Puccinia triticina 1-1 BBBD Race 1]|uniref:Uncharacterized protein n=2 Tax=Puccinia triticina TaxID=208348 RepID=A0A180GSD0_PUCT1|nr:hypothetical protein PTTG_12223 [Puccinia triticina 1-1 BBBD Race 1]
MLARAFLSLVSCVLVAKMVASADPEYKNQLCKQGQLVGFFDSNDRVTKVQDGKATGSPGGRCQCAAMGFSCSTQPPIDMPGVTCIDMKSHC